jgi:ppGpp synthetase/RelA/SpoT-type nucleotidyltranferase
VLSRGVGGYLVDPKPSGYRALHHEVKRDNLTIEVQLRTERQHAWANQVEDDGRALGTGYKFGFGAEEMQDYYETMGRAFAVLDRGESLSEEVRDGLRARYAKIRHILPGRQK